MSMLTVQCYSRSHCRNVLLVVQHYSRSHCSDEYVDSAGQQRPSLQQ
jgi:hypothetical protein